MLLANEASDYDDNKQADNLASLVAQAFPALLVGTRRLDQSGGDHIVLLVDNHIIFRFPRHGMHGFDLEIALLRYLQHLSPIATPDFQFIDPEGKFVGYPLIKGAALTPACYAALSQVRQHALLTAAAGFLATLHSLPANLIAPMGQWPISSPVEYASCRLARYVPAIGARFPKQARKLEAFYKLYRKLTAPRPVVVHGDLVAEHILLDEQSGRLCGIIDFSDVALGDPAQDFHGFWTYGPDAVRQLIELYSLSAKDAGLLARSRSHFIRYRLDRIFENVDSDAFNPDYVAVDVDALLTDAWTVADLDF